MASQQQQANAVFEPHSEFRQHYIQRLYNLDNFMCIVMDISRKTLRQTGHEFHLLIASYEEERQKNEQLSASNDLLRYDLNRCQQLINNLESQLYEDDSSESCNHSCCNELSELEGTLRLVEKLEDDIVQLEESKLRMQVTHDEEMEKVIQTYEGLLSVAQCGPIQDQTKGIELEVMSDV